MTTATFYKRCGCRHPDTGKLLNAACPKLRRRGGTWSADHGQWAYQMELGKDSHGKRQRLRRSGFDTRDAAGDDRDHAQALLDLAGRDANRQTQIITLLQAAARTHQRFPDIGTVRRRIRADIALDQAPTVGEYLTSWLAHLSIDPNTIRGYESHVRVHLIPHLGHILLEALRPRHIKAMFAAIEARNREIVEAKASDDPDMRASVRGIRPTGPATCQRIRATLRKALNDAIPEELVTINAAMYVDTPAERARPIVWTDERVARWRATGTVPGPVMVWTDEQIVDFLDYVADEDPDLHPMFHLIAYRGIRRGEACGLLEAEVRLGSGEVSIVNQIATHGYQTVQKKPKSATSNRDLVIDDDTDAVLAAYHARKAAHRLATGPAWPDTGLFFTSPDGTAWHPNAVTARFRRLVRKAGLPPIRLHDLRHSAATIYLAAGADVKVVQEMLGHTTSTLTRDTYQSVLPELHRQAADAVSARLAEKRRERRRAKAA